MPKHLELQRCSFVTFAQKRKSEREREREREGGGKEKEEKATALFGTVHDRGAIAMIKRKQEGEGGGETINGTVPSANARFLHGHGRERRELATCQRFTMVLPGRGGRRGECRTLFKWPGRARPRAFSVLRTFLPLFSSARLLPLPTSSQGLSRCQHSAGVAGTSRYQLSHSRFFGR
jgi:hypothetical protein